MPILSVTDVGRAVARSGLSPKTAAHFLDYFQSHIHDFGELLESAQAIRRDKERWTSSLENFNADLAYIFFHMCYSSPEFGDDETPARRFLPYPLGERRESQRAIRLQRYLALQHWGQDALATNAADLSVDWILGVPLSELEGRYQNLRGGMIRDMLRTAGSHLGALADILATAVNSGGEGGQSNLFAWCTGDQQFVTLRIIRRLRQYALQALAGIPDDILWMVDVVDSNGDRLIHRRLAMDLRGNGLRRLEDLLDRGRTNVLIQAIGRTPEATVRVEKIRQAARRARLERTERNRTRIERRLPNCRSLVARFLDSNGKEFEKSLEDCFRCLKIKVIGRDDNQSKPRYPDFVIEHGSNIIVVECKSSENGKDIGLSAATEVGGKAALHALATNHMITICQKYVSTDVPRQIETHANLSVINAEDLGVAMAYLKSKSIGTKKFMNWLTTPGQPLVEELFAD